MAERTRPRRILVRAGVSGDWFPNSSLSIVPVERKAADALGYYGRLGLRPDATAAEVKSAAKRLMAESHPDAGGDPEEFMAVHEAYEVLSDEGRRAEYDRMDAPRRGGVEVRIASAGPSVEVARGPSGPPCFYKEPWTVLTDDDIGKVREWQDMLLGAAREFRAALEIKAGVCEGLAGFSVDGDIALIGVGVVPERWAAELYVLREMSIE